MKHLYRFFRKLLFLVALLVAFLYITDYDYLIDLVVKISQTGRTTAGIDDYLFYDNRTLEKSPTPQPWNFHNDFNQTPQTPKLQALHDSLGTVAFLIIKNDSIWHESYYDGYDQTSKSNSFSMAKSIVCAALGRAIDEGFVKSLDQAVGDFLPEFNSGYAAQLTMGDLASMASGLEWEESYTNLLTITPRVYVEKDLDKLMRTIPIESQPGVAFRYLSGNTQLLAMALKAATGENIADLVKKWFWDPMGAEQNVLWQLDSEEKGLERAYCCFNSNARDFARFGKLFKQNGKWKGEQLIDSAFVAKSITPRFKESPEYGYGWWLGQRAGRRFYSMQGHLGQYVIVIPEEDVIVVRLGHRKLKNQNGAPHPQDCYYYIEEALKMVHHDRTS